MTRDTGPAGLVSLEGRVAVIAGSAGGIGSAIARLFAEARASVIGLDLRRHGELESVTEIVCDVADSGAVSGLFAGWNSRFGRLDVVVHCAGITQDGVLWKMDDDAWSRVLRVNLDSAFYLLRATAPLMRAQGGGSVVLVSSINGERGRFGQSNYVASKAGLIGLGRTAARELGRFGIRVNVIAPGLIETEMSRDLPQEFLDREVDETALEHTGKPADVARAALFLAGEMSRHVTGQVLRVDGGQLTA
jgi:acetoacetyl-CoA reductase/3-oxoacyl-[acyl-carrier protein] reductase